MNGTLEIKAKIYFFYIIKPIIYDFYLTLVGAFQLLSYFSGLSI